MHNKHDTWARAVLMHKNEASIFINLALKLKEKDKISSDKLQLQDNRFITKSFYNRETDIIYKLENKNAYILIEHQSSVDKNMAKRIIEYIVEIIRKDEKDNNIKNTNYKLPLVIPIVFYTGKNKWTAKRSIVELQEKIPGYNSQDFGRYILVDTNKFSQEKLLKNKGILSKIVLLDKSKDRKEIEAIYEKIEINKLTKEEIEMLDEYTCNISINIVGEEKLYELRSKYKIREGGKQMLVETLKKEIMREKKKAAKEGRAQGMAKGIAKGIEKGRAKGKEEGIKEGQIIGLEKVAKEMLKENIDIEIVKRWTKLEDKRLERIKSKI